MLKTVPLYTAVAFAMITSTGVEAAKASLNGRWIMGDGDGVLVIHGQDWFHPRHGAATIQRGTGSAAFEVFYNKAQGARCAYRAETIADGDILVLESADATQSPDFCPSGKLSKVSK